MTTPMNGIYVLQTIEPAGIAAAPAGVKVVDLYTDAGSLATAAQVSQMKTGGGDVLGYFSIGEAENYRSYFSSLPSSVLGPVDPDWPGDYEVAYWTPQWKAIAENYIDTMVSLGYDGAYFDVVDEAETSWAASHAPGGDSRGAMVTLIQQLGQYAHAKDPSFKIWINSSGSEDMLANQALVKAVDGAFEEELFFKDNGSPEAKADVAYNLGLLDNLVNAGKSVVAIEYVTGASTVASVKAQAAAAGVGYYIANPDLELKGVDTEGFGSSNTGGSLPGTGGSTGGNTGGSTGTGGTPVAATVTAVKATPTWGDIGTGAIVKVALTFNKVMTVSGAPALTLNDGGSARYLTGSGTNTLTFQYQVGTGQNTTDLAIKSVALASGSSVKDASATAANLGKAVGSLPGRLIVDTARVRTTIATGTGQNVDAGSGNHVVTLSGGNARLVFGASNNVAFLGGGSGTVNATIVDQSKGLVIDVLAGGRDTIVGLASDPTAVVDLLGGLGGYTSASQVLSALKSDHQGGSVLSLGSGQSIHFVGAAPSNLHQNNFLVG